ncbi:MAG: BON domain-containing protein [Candidatus Didemnitutus sp.]|nr:BON domain-containing protein [Candidatus Didemnitutus sp.]
MFRSHTLLFVFFGITSAVFATPAIDQRIEEAARNTFNLRVVLGDQGALSIHSLNGVVALTGTVRDVESKRLAGSTIEHISGVARVDNLLIVSDTPPEFSDGWISNAIHRRLMVQANLNIEALHIAVKNGFVTLSGTSLTHTQMEQMATIAATIPRVRGVRNDLTISMVSATGERSMDRVDDASLNTLIKQALTERYGRPRFDITVRTRDGLVMISGWIESDLEKSAISAMIRAIRGTREVSNNLRVRA